MTLSGIPLFPVVWGILRFFYLFVGEWVIEKEREMKVVAFNGSARKDGNTAILVDAVFKELKREKIKTELIQLA
jgi:hypothetical protein